MRAKRNPSASDVARRSSYGANLVTDKRRIGSGVDAAPVSSGESPTSSGALILSYRHVTHMLDDARARRPHEACGLLGGLEGRVERIYPLTNTERSGVRYLAEPQAQLDAMLDIEERGWHIVGIYHTHLEAPAYPSPTDVAMAAYPGVAHLIISLTDGNSPVLRAFTIQGNEIGEVDLIVESPEPAEGQTFALWIET